MFCSQCATISLASCNSFEELRSIYHGLDGSRSTDWRPSPARGRTTGTKCGYRFEDDELVEEMLAEVEGERGALPLLAFAMARLWEKRDREKGRLITRQAYGTSAVSGERWQGTPKSTLDRIGVRARCRSCARSSATSSLPRAPAPSASGTSCCQCLTSDDTQGEDPRPRKRCFANSSMLAC